MSRYTGPRVKIMRALGADLPGLSSKSMERRPYPPGQHGQMRRKLSEYAVRLQETKKLRMNYGLSEKQLRRLITEAAASREVSTDKLLELVERRLDNVVFRAGFARTIPAARQMVCHGHILVNGKRADVASFRVKAGMEISMKKKPEAAPDVKNPSPEWLEADAAEGKAKVLALPTTDALLVDLNVNLIIEHYSRRI